MDEPGWATQARGVAAGIRRRVLEHVLAEGEGYLSQACSSAEVLAVLYTRVLRLAPVTSEREPPPFDGVPGPGQTSAGAGRWVHGAVGPEFDRFVVSPAHYALPLYATLIEVGRLAPTALEQFNRDGSTVEMIGAEHSPGFEVTTGSLAQGLSQAAGVALARQRRLDAGHVWVFLSDGEFQEGQTWEALACASFYQLANLRMVVDANGQQCDGKITSVGTIEPLADRVRAFGVSATEIDGHDLIALEQAMSQPAQGPHLVIARTDPTRGVPPLADRKMLHTVRLTSAEERRSYQAAYEDMVR
ncbi:MAG: thiamine pyrophosphate-dependent enzyme [Candidatus Dormibacteria bacterium]